MEIIRFSPSSNYTEKEKEGEITITICATAEEARTVGHLIYQPVRIEFDEEFRKDDPLDVFIEQEIVQDDAHNLAFSDVVSAARKWWEKHEVKGLPMRDEMIEQLERKLKPARIGGEQVVRWHRFKTMEAAEEDA
jgi:hypothetical protein